MLLWVVSIAVAAPRYVGTEAELNAVLVNLSAFDTIFVTADIVLTSSKVIDKDGVVVDSYLGTWSLSGDMPGALLSFSHPGAEVRNIKFHNAHNNGNLLSFDEDAVIENLYVCGMSGGSDLIEVLGDATVEGVVFEGLSGNATALHVNTGTITHLTVLGAGTNGTVRADGVATIDLAVLSKAGSGNGLSPTLDVLIGTDAIDAVGGGAANWSCSQNGRPKADGAAWQKSGAHLGGYTTSLNSPFEKWDDVDLDDHGYGPGTDDDCNDADPSYNPDADEICDTFDQDCDLIADNEPAPGSYQAVVGYVDEDGDGHGVDAEVWFCGKLPDEGYAQVGDDACDDDPTAFLEENCPQTSTGDDDDTTDPGDDDDVTEPGDDDDDTTMLPGDDDDDEATADTGRSGVLAQQGCACASEAAPPWMAALAVLIRR